MKGKTVGFLTLVCVGIAAAGYCAGAGLSGSGQVQEENSTQREWFAESSEMKTPSVDMEGTDISDEMEEKTESFISPDSQEKSQEETEDTEEVREIKWDIPEETKWQEQKDSEPEATGRLLKKESAKMSEEVPEELPKEVPKETDVVREKDRTENVPDRKSVV